MFYYMVLRLVYLVYLLGVLFVWYHALSRILFSLRGTRRERWANARGLMLFAFIWPLALFSGAGLRRLKTLWKRF